MVRCSVKGSTLVASSASRTDENVPCVPHGRNEVFLGNCVDQVIASKGVHHFEKRKDMVQCIEELLLDAILGVCFVGDSGSP